MQNKSIWIMKAEENNEYELLNKIQSKYHKLDNEFNVNKSRKAYSQDSNLREIPSVDIGTPKKYLWMPRSRACNFGFMRPATSVANKRINIELPNYKEKLSPKHLNFFFKEDSCQQNIRFFPKRSEFLKLRKAKERISKKKMKWRLLARNNNNNQIELDLSVQSRARNSIDTFLTSPVSTPTTPTIYEHRAKSSNFLKRRSVSSWSKRKEASPLKINFVEEEKIPLTPW